MRGLHTSEKKMKEKTKQKQWKKKSIPTYYLSFNSGEKNQQKTPKRITTFCPNFCPLDTIQVKTRVIDDQIFQILFQTTTSQLHTKTHTQLLKVVYVLKLHTSNKK